MTKITRCWAPCFELHQWVDLEHGTILIAWFSAFIHFLSLTYGIYILTGGVTDTFYSPLFEFNKYGAMVIATCTLLYSIAFIFCCSLGLIHGVKRETRFFYLPWLWCSFLELLAMVGFGIFMVYRYWHFGWAHFASITLWVYSAYHFYLFRVVLAQYYVLKNFQNPTFIIINY